MSARDQIITKVLNNGKKMLGTDYSRATRDNIWPGGSADCSSLTAMMWSAAGFLLLGSSGQELRTSCYQVNAVGFSLVYPSSIKQVGKNLPSPKGLLSSYGAKPGDIVFWNFDKATTRSNKITHVGSIDANGKQIIHTANNKEKCCVKPLTYGDGSICAIIRLNDGVVLPTLREISRPTGDKTRPEEWMVRMLQAALNLQCGEKLVVDGLFGPKLETAVAKLNATIGIPNGVCTLRTWKMLGFNAEVGEEIPEPIEPTTERTILEMASPMKRGEDIALFQDGLNRMGFDCGPADGICGEKTIAGAEAFIAAHQHLNKLGGETK